jgi:hypothetical protein
LRREANVEDRAVLADVVTAGPDWLTVAAVARRHRVSSPILAGLQACGAPLPPDALSALRPQSVRSARRGLSQVKEIARLARNFERAGIPMLVLKGAVLSEQLYGDPILRSARDIDLLVAPEQFVAADDLLIAEGYRHTGRDYSKREFEAYRRRIKDLDYVNDATRVRLELHHRLTDNQNLLACDFQFLHDTGDQVVIAEAPVHTLPRQTLPLYLCVHGASHGWHRLIWLADFAGSLRGPAAAEAAFEQAENYGLGPLMLHTLALAHIWLGTPVPKDLLRDAGSTRQGRALNRVLAALFSGTFLRATPRTRADRWRNIWLLRAYTYLAKLDFRYWRSQLARDLVSPADWGMLQLPERLFWLYPLLRPFGWLFRRPDRADDSE